jgi:hypothetical protein
MRAHAFETEAVDGRDGYTILHLPSAVPAGASPETETLGAPAFEYISWEFSTGT